MQFDRRRLALLAGAHVLLGLLFLSPGYIRPDSVAVYSWLRSAVFDGDLLFLNEWHRFGMISGGVTWFKEVTPLGTLANHWWIGTSLIAAPPYLLSIPIAWLGSGGVDGFAGLLLVVLAWTSVAMTCVSLILADGALSKEDSMPPLLRTFVLAAVLFGTPLFWYTFRFPLGTHAAGALCVGAAAYLIRRDLGSHGYPVGLLLGLAGATRLQHVLLLPVVLVAGLLQKAPRSFYLKLAAGALPPMLAQAAAWWVVYGSPLGPLTGGANLAGVTWMPFHSSHLAAVLFSSYHGLFSWAPVTLLAIAGWVLALRTPRRAAAVTFLGMFAAEWIANATFDRYFWGGLSFGPRRFVDLAVPFAFGLGWMCLLGKRIALALISIATAWTVGLSFAALAGTLSLSRYLSSAELFGAIADAFKSSGRFSSRLLSPVVDPPLLVSSLVGISIVALVCIGFTLLGRRWTLAASIYLLLCSLYLLALWPSTRSRAPQEVARFGIDGRAAARWGPLTDQRQLLTDEIDYLTATGRIAEAYQTRREIEKIDSILKTLR